MIIDPFLNNPKKLDYQLSNSIYKPKTKKMKLINEVLKETTEQNYTLDIYISECKHDETTPEEWVKEKTHKFQVVFHFNNVPNPNYGFSYYIDTIMDSYWGNTGGLCLYGHKYDYASVSEEVMDRVRAFIQRFVDANNLNLHKENG